MDKKDIYEHLAKIYLDNTPSRPEKKHPLPARKRKYYLLASIPFIAGTCVFLLLVSFRSHPALPLASTSLIVSGETIKMGFNLETAKKHVYDLDLKSLNLNDYKLLVFSLRDSNYSDRLSFRVEFTNAYRERGELYVNDVSNKWKEYQFKLADFKGISDWSEMTGLSFAVEEWNTRDNKGILFIDNVRFLK